MDRHGRAMLGGARLGVAWRGEAGLGAARRRMARLSFLCVNGVPLDCIGTAYAKTIDFCGNHNVRNDEKCR